MEGIIMTVSQKEWLLKLWFADQYSPSGTLSVVYDNTPTRVMRKLEDLGYCTDIMGTFWKITEAGKEAAKTIY